MVGAIAIGGAINGANAVTIEVTATSDVDQYSYRRDQRAIAAPLRAGRILASHATLGEGRNVQAKSRRVCSTSDHGQIFWAPR